MLLLIGVDPIARFAWSAPFDAFPGAAPIMFTVRLAHGGSHHFQSIVFPFGWWIVGPVWRNRIVYLQVVIRLGPSLSRVIMYKHACVPRPIQPFWATVKAFGGFIKELCHMLGRKNDSSQCSLSLMGFARTISPGVSVTSCVRP